MHAAKVPYLTRKTQREVAQLRGINYTDRTQDGDLAESQNLSARRFPYLATRASREVVAQYLDADAYYRFDGHTVVCAGGRLYFDGEDKCAVTDGEKQFAVVGTKLCVFPDKLLLDVQSGAVERMDAGVTSVPTVTENGIAFPFDYDTGDLGPSRLGDYYYYAYDCTVAQFAAAWDGTAWDLSKVARYRRVCSSSAVGAKLLIVDADDSPIKVESESDPEPVERYNTRGRFMAGNIRAIFALTGAPSLAGFAVGDVVDVSGSAHALLDRKCLKIASVDAEANAVTFTAASFPGQPIAAGVLEADLPPVDYSEIAYYARYGGSIYQFANVYGRLTEYRRGDVVCLYSRGGERHIGVWRQGRQLDDWSTGTMSSEKPCVVTLQGLSAQTVTIRKSVPDLDAVCEHQNRLWGVVNAQDNAVWDERAQEMRHVTSRVIVASALGEPTKFYQFAGVATDSYALAIAGEGDFTGIASVGGSVCAFKERKIHKILGSYPAEYYLSDRDAVGVQSGCAKSLARIGSMLLYKGIGGVYAYNGSTPSLISANLGTRAYYDAVGGADEDSYYLSCRDGDNVWHLFNYDAKTGIWLHEDNTQTVDFANDGAALFFLDTSGAVRRCNGVSDDPDVVWSAQFSPLYERQAVRRVSSTVTGRKRYGKILLRVDVPKGAWLVAEVRQDDSDWREVGYVGGGERDVKPMVIMPGRCDKFELRLRGKGPCTVLSLMREFSVGSDR